MAAEKLTKGRLAQILFMMVLLLGAFTWRSITYSNSRTLCQAEQDCVIKTPQGELKLLWQKNENSYVLQESAKARLKVETGGAQIAFTDTGWALKELVLPLRIRVIRQADSDDLYQFTIKK